RIWHWINAIGFIVLILTGAQIRFVDSMGLMSFETAVQIHSWLGFILLANYFIWLLYYLFSGKLFKIYIPPFWKPVEFIKNSIKQAKYYGYGIMVGDENPHHPIPENKFNPLQQVSYLMIMVVLIPLQIITGLILWDPQLFGSLAKIIGGLQIATLIHTGLWIFFSTFIIVHFYLATLGHTPMAHIKAMFTGYEEEHEEH
ncbi:cytochrome b/b6 domain-containing protein, partial [Thermodesulfovibrio sp.]|uniref:cytochrome b/b6 domain-containing protein n=1 Tax=Thermodesulfovibrio sp. TaxID=2067987 RepID=UPI003D126DDB